MLEADGTCLARAPGHVCSGAVLSDEPREAGTALEMFVCSEGCIVSNCHGLHGFAWCL